MSFEHTAIAMNHSESTGSARSILFGIASHANELGEAYPGMMKLAQYANFTGWDAEPEDDTADAIERAKKARNNARRQAIRAVQSLEALGEIKVETNGGGTRNKPHHERPNLYTITLTCPPDCDHSAQHRKRSTTAIREAILGGMKDPVTPESPRDSRVTTPVTPESPESSLNQLPQQTLNETPAVTASDRVKSEESEAAEIEHQPVKRPDYSKQTTTPAKVAPAPRVPRFDPASVPTGPDSVTPEMQAANAQANLLPCSEGFGTGTGSRHLILVRTGEGCARCGLDAFTILDQANQLGAEA